MGSVSSIPEAVAAIRQAIDILEYALGVTSGSDRQNIVPVATRYPLIKAWVLCKGLMNQALPKTFSLDQDAESQTLMSKALCALEALSLQSSFIVEFQISPSIHEVSKKLFQGTYNCLLQKC